jgi:hypothetical protein
VGGGVEQVSSSSSFEAFLAELKQARNLSEIHLLADGPRGEFMGVHVDRDLKRLRLLAHVDLARFQTFADHLAKGLRRAKLREMDDADPDAPAGKAERKPWVVAVVTGLLAFVAAFSGSKAYEAMREAPELIIDSPRLHDGQADASPPTVLVSWTYKKPRVLGPARLDGAHPAVIEVTGEPAGQVVYSHRDPGRAQIPILTAGRYLVRITTDGAYRSFELNVMAPPEKAPAPPRGGSTPPPRGPKKPRGAAPQASTSPELGD